MNIIKNIENKVKIAFIVAIASVAGSITIVALTLNHSRQVIGAERDKIYVIDNGIPVLVQRTNEDVNRHVEYESHIKMFHTLFFTLPPDDDFMQANIGKAMYLIDDSGMLEHTNLKERGYYSQILSSSASLSIKTDSIQMNYVQNRFKYYGTQRIDRKSKVVFRNIITQGSFSDIPRSENNPHGVIITDWRTLENKDIKEDIKKIL